MRALSILVAAIVVVFAGGLLVFRENAASPPPSQVLSRARSYASGSRSIGYHASEQLAVPSGSAQLVWHREITGQAMAPGTTDMLATPPEGGPAYEYRTLGGSAGMWVRAAGSPWVRSAGYLAFETTLRHGPAGPLTALADRLGDGAVVGVLLAGARNPARHGRAVRQLDVVFDPGLAGGVSSITGQISVDAGNRPTKLVAHLRYHDATIDVAYALSWRPPMTLSAP